MPKFNSKNPGTRITNLAGGKAFKFSPELELIHGVLTTFLDDKYYESGDDRQARLVSLISQVDPKFVAKLAVIARNEFHLRSVSHLMIGEMAKLHKPFMRQALIACTERPDDLTETASYYLSKTGSKSLSKQLKRGIRNALLKFNRYQLGKYRGEGNNVSLVDLFNLAHPKVQHASEEQKLAWKDLIEGNLKADGTWEKEISGSKDAEEKTQNWEALIRSGKVGYMALLRNLNNLIKNGVSDEVIKLAATRLADPEQVRKSKQLPFRFYTAYNIVNGNRRLSDAISLAMDVSVENAPRFEGKTLIGIDSSDSMKSNNKNGFSASQIASIFGAILLKSNPDADVILFDTKVREVTVSGRTPVLDIVRQIEGASMGGGTATSLVFDYAKNSGKNYERIIIISDNESWADAGYGGSYSGGSVQMAYNTYKSKTDSDPYVFAIDVAGYGTKDISSPKVFHVSGWSDRVLDFIGNMERGETLIDYVKNYKIEGIKD